MREAEEKGERKRGEGREKAGRRLREGCEKGERKRGKVYEKAVRRERESEENGEGKRGKWREARTDIIVMDTIFNEISFILRYTRSED